MFLPLIHEHASEQLSKHLYRETNVGSKSTASRNTRGSQHRTVVWSFFIKINDLKYISIYKQ